MKVLDQSNINRINGGKRLNGGGFSSNRGYATSAIPARNPEGGKKAVCLGAAAASIYAPTRSIAAVAVIAIGIKCN